MISVRSVFCLVVVFVGVLHGRAAGEAADFDTAARLFQEDRWQDAAQAYEEIAEENANSAFVWFRLGVLYRKLGRLGDAAEAFERSGTIADYADPNVIRMLTEVSIEKGDTERALYWLQRWVEIGLRPAAMETHPELAPLRETAEFKNLVRAAASNDRGCDTPQARQFDFWVGDWDVANHHRVPIGRDRVESILNGCVILENWSGFRGNDAKSFSVYDPDLGQWRQDWLTDDGKHFRFVGGYADGAMRMEGEVVNPDGRQVRNRMTWRRRDDGSVHQVFENASSAGGDWYTVFELTYTPRQSTAE